MRRRSTKGKPRRKPRKYPQSVKHESIRPSSIEKQEVDREFYEVSLKKRKDDKSDRDVSLTNIDYTLLMHTMTKVSNQCLNNIDEQKTKLTNNVTNLLQTLCKVVKEVRMVVDCRLQFP